MSQYRLRLSSVVMILATCSGCGTTRQVGGDWNGRVAPLHFDYLELRLTQDGKVLRGTACYEVLPGSEEGYVSFRNATVTGMYPTIQIETAANGFRFEGQFQDERTLVGHWTSSSSTTPSPMSLSPGTVPTAGCL
jgi:hypothetical protein